MSRVETMSSSNNNDFLLLVPEHDDYTDYSCSTSVERLARDVETLLRKWHVDEGSDRHLSFTTATTTTTTNNNGTPVRSNQQQQPPKQPQPKQQPGNILRSAKIIWVLSFYLKQQGTKFSVDIELELNLWDGPTSVDTNHYYYHHHPDDKYHHCSSSSSLPLSLQRSLFSDTPGPSNNNFRWLNFSTLFGIGQHITLTPLVVTDIPPPDDSNEPWPRIWKHYFLPSLYSRHDAQFTASFALQQTLSSCLQTALNLAVEQTNCQIPVFGFWASGYNRLAESSHDDNRPEQAFYSHDLGLPPWLQHSIAVQSIPLSRHIHKIQKQAAKNNLLNLQQVPPLLQGTCHAGPDLRVSFWLGLLLQEANTPRAARLATWGDLLSRYCNNNNSSTPSERGVVHLWEARHVYCWINPWLTGKNRNKSTWARAANLDILESADEDEEEDEDSFFATPPASPLARQPPQNKRLPQIPHWRRKSRHSSLNTSNNNHNNKPSRGLNAPIVFGPAYRQDCQNRILELVSIAAGASAEDPLWGPVGDPVQSIWAKLTWAPSNNTPGTPPRRNADKSQSREPLLRLPLKIRSNQTLSREDWMEAEEAMEASVLNPIRALEFAVRIELDPSVVQTPLAAMQHCVLAALIRTSTLPNETLLNHLIDADVLEKWDTAAGNVIAMDLGQRAQVGSTTTALLKAMDWDYAMEDMIEPWQALEICRSVLDEMMLQVVSPPEDNLPQLLDQASHDPLLYPLAKAAPFGRLFSILCAYISRVRSPSSMVQVFTKFCQELRRRWDFRESLPNMNYIPGVDPPPSLSMQNASAAVRILGLPAPPLAAYSGLVGGDVEPDEFHCLIGQKLQVFNLCLETVIRQELRQVAKLEKQRSSSPLYSAASSDDNLDDFESLPPMRISSSSVRSAGETGILPNGNDASDHSTLTPVFTFEPMTSGSPSRKPRGRTIAAANNNNNNKIMLPGVSFDATSVEFSAEDHTSKSVATKQSSQPSTSVATSAEFFDAKSVASQSTQFTDARSRLTDGSGPSKRFADLKNRVTGASDSVNGQESTYYSANGAGDDPKNVTVNFNEAIFNGKIQADQQDDQSVAMQSLARYQDANQSVATRSTIRSQYFDAEAGALDDSGTGWNTRRRGARCPIHGQTLKSNGDQVFAPYLQRPVPLTDDLVAQRRMLLESTSVSTDKDWLERLEVAHRIQRPKLLSDMSAFKAANPGCELSDFTIWYGEPANPLENTDPFYGVDENRSTASDRQQVRIREANRAVLLLEKTRAFWAQTWQDAKAIPALEQEPLFSASDTVEIALDYLETLHPANLICSVMATNLSNAYFSLVISAGDSACLPPTVQASLLRLRRKIEIALTFLSHDSTRQFSRRSSAPPHGYFSYVSVETIQACEAACRLIGENETLLSQTLSLTNKFPNQVDLVEQLLDKTKHTVSVGPGPERVEILEALLMLKQPRPQKHFPVSREYMFRNADDSTPCQLCVRCGGGGGTDKDGENSTASLGGLLVAMTRTEYT